MPLLIVFATCCVLFNSSFAHAVKFESSVEQIGLLELYTSEGCSSCPPADRWLSSLKDDEGLWHEFIPVAFHVDYWDYIGWNDRFASPDNSNRQRQYAREQSLKTVYTPGFVYNGQEWRGWFARRFMDFPKGRKPGVLSLNITDGLATATFVPQLAISNDLTLNVALLGFGLNSAVTAGENRGRELPHDFIVLGREHVKFKRQADHYQTRIPLPKPAVTAPSYAVVAWVSRGNKLTPLQATGGPISSASGAFAFDSAQRRRVPTNQ